MRVLVACEYSGRVRDAFTKKGHYAMSCDLLPTESPGLHYQGDIFKVLDPTCWELLIAHPPCTHLSSSGARYWEEKQKDGRQQQAIDFFLALATCIIPRKCIENPVGIMSKVWRKPDQYIQPYEYGHPEQKKTCLWLEGVPPLKPTKIVPPTWYADGKPRYDNQTPGGQNKYGPSNTDRAKLRALTYQGWADAMAEQWG